MSNRIEITYIEHHRVTTDTFIIRDDLAVKIESDEGADDHPIVITRLTTIGVINDRISLSVYDTERLIEALKKGLEILSKDE